MQFTQHNEFRWFARARFEYSRDRDCSNQFKRFIIVTTLFRCVQTIEWVSYSEPNESGISFLVLPNRNTFIFGVFLTNRIRPELMIEKEHIIACVDHR